MEWIRETSNAVGKIRNINKYKNINLLYLSPNPIEKKDENSIEECEYIVAKVTGVPSTAELKQIIFSLQHDYDFEDRVNCFYLNGEKCWLDKATRVGLNNSLNIQKATGQLNTVLWLNGKAYEVSIDYLLGFLEDLELYAIDCYNVTQIHLSQIAQITDREGLLNYNVACDYPVPLEFDTSQIIHTW